MLPVVIECSTSLEKTMLAFIVDSFGEKERSISKDKTKEMKMVSEGEKFHFTHIDYQVVY